LSVLDKGILGLLDKIGDAGEKILKFVLLITFVGVPVLSYPLAIYRWFATEHLASWHGFKELLWVCVPMGNIFYVWDIWWDMISSFVSFVWAIISLVY
tara:strand:- start:109 stop:402 length:294 start_codon:yes stop_codon:yes gene_type:complete